MTRTIAAATALLTAISLLGSPLRAEDARYPDDSFSRPQVDRWQSFETVTGVQPPGNPVQRLADYEVNELRAVTRGGLPWASWRFTCRPGRGAVLCFSDRIRRLPTAVTVRIANASDRPASFAVTMPEMPWSPDPNQPYFNWVVNGDAPVAPGEERVVRFDLSGLHADKAVAGQRPTPPTSINLHVGSTDPGVAYHFDLREWTVLYPDATGVHVTSLAAPPRLVPVRMPPSPSPPRGCDPMRSQTWKSATIPTCCGASAWTPRSAKPSLRLGAARCAPRRPGICPTAS